jgi:hypothetical protein
MVRCGKALGLGLLLVLGLGCGSPNRGTWRGEFGGSLSGTMQFTIGGLGDKLTGKMEGRTQQGQPFDAKLKGKVRGEAFYATFEGSASASGLPVAFEGLMKGTLGQGQAAGDWTAEIQITRNRLQGDWQAERVSEPGS